MTIFWEKGGIVFKEGHYVREDIIQGNTVYAIYTIRKQNSIKSKS